MLDLLIGDNAALFQIHQQHLAGLQAALIFDVLRLHRQDAGFRRQDQLVVLGDQVTRRRRPLRSSVAPIHLPSVNATAAGPSQGSISDA